MQPVAYDLLRLLRSGEAFSAARLAALLQLSPERVQASIAALRVNGIAVQHLRDRGYFVQGGIDLLDAGLLRSLPVQVDVIDECPSTNTALLAEAAQDAKPRLLVCEWQTAGRGRRGNTWRSGLADSLSFSLSWSFVTATRQLPGLSLAVGVACVRVMNSLRIPGVALKWPNDLVHAQGKLGGILIELKPGSSTAVVGIGLNIRNASRYRADVFQPVADLAQLAAVLPSRTELLRQLVLELIAVMSEFETRGFAAFREEWSRHHAHAGQRVRLMSGDEQIEGIAQGVGEDGALLLSTDQGEQRFFSGELRQAA